MFGQAARSSGMYVAEQANFQWNSFVEDVLREAAQLHCFAIGDSDVINQTSDVADAVGPAVLNGLPNRFFSKALAGVNGDIEILALNVVERVYVLLWRKPALFAGEIETHNAALAKINREFSHLQRDVHIAHRAHDQARQNSEIPLAPLQPFQNSVDHLLMGKPLTRMKDRSEAA